MKIIRINEEYSPVDEPVAATVGFFDGVHAGHRYLIKQLKDAAKAKNLPTAIVTFTMHPQLVLNPRLNLPLLTALDEKMRLLADNGIDKCFLATFTQEFSCTDAESFIKNFLAETLNVKLLAVGYDHRFGKHRHAGYDEYVKFGAECGMDVIRAAELPGGHISSTVIRKTLEAGCVEEAAKMLEQDYQITGEVIQGSLQGRTIGFPTANLRLVEEDKLIPGTGVYEVDVLLRNEQLQGMAYIGTRPTLVDQGELRIEVNIFNFNQDIYGETLTLKFKHFIREDRAFNSVEDLQIQLVKDKNYILSKDGSK
ncbi:MAG: riboflavin biosynthesis protein RibF [Dysgonamonadaceae bacterium]|jgi:riboflavin kinase/FMN adenylyltransferase|nr:riboflavin biosynthesis protein RibF [Dysgonamonadaceae bacterium]